MRLLIIGNRGGTNVGGCFERAANEIGVTTAVIESRRAMDAPPWLRYMNWHLRGHRPTQLRGFGEEVIRSCRRFKPTLALSTGLAPLTSEVLAQIRADGCPVVNYLTDDPWNPAHRAAWFLRALPHYSMVFSPRRRNLGQIREAGCQQVAYVPFAYDPSLHFREEETAPSKSHPEVVFIGGSDSDRVPYLLALIESGIGLSLYGDYWGRYPRLTPHWKGYADPETARAVTRGASICLCLVRRANRDGHTMRSFEAAAMGGCLLVEHTDEHEEIFGPEGQAVTYFKSLPEMLQKMNWLLANGSERRRLGESVYKRISSGAHTYRDRLTTILTYCDTSGAVQPPCP